MHTTKRKVSTRLAFATLPVVAVMALANSAYAAPVYDTSLAPPGVYFGTGNANTNFVTNTASNIELGLGTINRYLGPVAPNGNSSVYNVATGASLVPGITGSVWDFEFSINTDVSGGDGLPLTAFTSTLCVQDVGAGSTTCFDPTAIPDDSHSSSSPLTTAQNAEALQFGDLSTRFFDPNYDINANDTYILTLSVGNTDGTLDSVQMTDIAGTGAAPVPEPFSIGLLGLGLAGIGAMRRKNKTA